MNQYSEIALLIAGGFFLTVALVPASMRFASMIGAMDQPGKIKIHATPIPRIGGLAIFISILLFYFFFPQLSNTLTWKAKAVLLMSVGLVFTLGLIDDIKNIRPWIKLFFQMLSVSLVVLGLYTTYSSLQIYYLLFIFFLILGYTNSFNLLDGMDGLAGGVTLLSALSLLIISIIADQPFTLGFAALLMGTTMGFLLFNFNPARIFLGDCGSTALGFSTALILSLIWIHSSNHWVIIPLLMIAGTPLLDTAYTVLRRIKNRRSLFHGDRSHLYDFILQSGFSVRQTVILFYGLSLILSVSGIVLFLAMEG